MSSDLTSAHYMAIQNAGYIVERDENKNTGITLRAKYGREVIFSVTAPDDELASSKLLLLVDTQPLPGSPEAARERRQQVLTRPDLWSPLVPKNSERKG